MLIVDRNEYGYHDDSAHSPPLNLNFWYFDNDENDQTVERIVVFTGCNNASSVQHEDKSSCCTDVAPCENYIGTKTDKHGPGYKGPGNYMVLPKCITKQKQRDSFLFGEATVHRNYIGGWGV